MHPELTRPALAVAALALALAPLVARRTPWGAARGVQAALRLAGLACLVVVAGGLLLRGGGGATGTVVLADISASIGAEGARVREAFIEQLRGAPDLAEGFTIVRFAGQPQVEQPVATGTSPGPGAAAGEERLLPGETDLGLALVTAVGAVAPGRRPLLVVLSDGEETRGGALAALPELRAAAATVLAYDLSVPRAPALTLRSVAAPREVFPAERFELRVVIGPGDPQQVEVALERNGVAVDTRTVSLDGSADREVVFAERAPAAGPLVYRVRLRLPDRPDEAPLQRDVPVAVGEPLAVAYCAPASTAPPPALQVLRTAGVRVTVLEPAQWRTLELSPPGVLVLDNVAAPDLGREGQEAVAALVRERGMGLLALGGRQSLGAGSWLDTPLEQSLPVVMGAPQRGPDADLSLVVVVDASLSMFFRGRDEDPFLGRGPRKMDIAKSAILEVLAALRPQDRFGLLDSRDELTWIRRPAPVSDRAELEARVNAVAPMGGGINFYSSIREAWQGLRDQDTPLRHIMVIADANDIDQAEVAQLGRADDLVRELARERVTLSIFAIGYPSDKDIAYLKRMAVLGGGDFYLVSNLLTLPRYFRAEYQRKAGEWLREERSSVLMRAPSAVLRGIPTELLPEVDGVNLVATRPGAEEVLVLPTGAPLLALWGYGRGRTAVFAADNGTGWARGWYDWGEAERFWTQLVQSLAPRPAPPALEVRAQATRERGRFTARRHDGLAHPGWAGTVIYPGAALGGEAALERVGVDRYEAPLPPSSTGYVEYLLPGAGGGVVARGALEVPPHPESRPGGRGKDLLAALTRGTGGEVIASPGAVAPRARRAAALPPDPTFWLLAAALAGLFASAWRRR